jgi:tetratricopeptide (TPR) repeat protein
MMTIRRPASVRRRFSRRPWLVPLWLLLCAVAVPSALTAQAIESARTGESPLMAAERVRTALLQLAVSAAGSFGDEGPQISMLVESLAGALDNADRVVASLTTQPGGLGCSAQIDLARTLFVIGRPADAVAALDTAARKEACVEALLLRGLVHLRSGDSTQASKTFLTAWERDRSNAKSAYWLVHSDPAIVDRPEGQRALDVLRSAYAAALAQNPASKPQPRFATLDVASRIADGTPVVLPVAYMRGYSLLLAGERDRALTEWRRALATDPLLTDSARTSPDVAAGIAALRRGHLSEGRDRFTQAVVLEPASSEAHRLLATAHWLERDLESAARQLKVAVGLRADDERSRLMLARVFDEMGALGNAETMLRETLDRLPHSGLVQLSLAMVYQKLNRDADMARLYAAIARDSAPLDGQSRLFARAGSLYQNAGDTDAAFDAFLRSVRADPNVADVHAELARAQLEYDWRDGAYAEYVASLLIDPADPNAYLGIGQLHLNAGRYAEALTALERLVRLQPNYAAARYMLGNALVRVGRTDEGARELAAFQQLETAAADRRRRTMAAGVIREEALMRAAQGNVERAASLWQQLIQLEPEVAAHHAALGALLADARQPGAALTYLERAAALGAPPDVYRRLATVYAALGRADDSVAARARYERAVLAPARAEPGR